MRVSSPDRVIYEATDRTPAVTKLMVARVLRAGRGRADARAARPAHRAGTLAGRRPPGIKLATGRPGEKADAFYQKRVPKGAPDYLQSVDVTFPSGRTAAEICPTEIAVPVWCAQMGTLTFHPWPVRRTDVDRPDELRIDLDPQPGHVVPRRGPRRRRGQGAARRARPGRLPEDLRQPRRAHLRAHPAAVGLHRRPARRDRVRPGAGAARRRRHHRSGGRRSAASGCSSTSTRTAATARSPRPTRCARSPAPR